MAQPVAEERKTAQGQIQGGGGGLQTAPTGNVYSPRVGHAEESGNTRRWASALGQFGQVAGALAVQEQAKQNKADFLNGQMEQMAGKTWKEMEDAGANKTTLQGFTTMQAVTFNNKWQAEEMENINNGQYASMLPADYQRQKQEQFKGVLTGNEFTDNITTALAAESMPKLAAAQMTAHSRWKEERTYNASRDALVTASINNDSNQLAELLKPETYKALGLTEGRWNDALAEAVTLSYENGSTVLPNALGLNQFTKSSVEAAKLPDRLNEGFKQIVTEATAGTNVPAEFLMRIAATESGGNPKAVGPMTKHGTAKGAFQFIDSTWKQYGGGGDVFNPQDAAKAATKYMSHLLGKYNGDQVLAAAAYNSGEGTVDGWLKKGRPRGYFLPETEGYIQKNFGVDIYSANGSSLLGGNWSAAQQSKMLNGKIKYAAAQEEKWSLDHARQSTALIDAYNRGDITFEELDSQMSQLGLSTEQYKTVFTQMTDARREQEKTVMGRYSPEQQKELGTARGGISTAPASLEAFNSNVDRIFPDVSPAEREKIKDFGRKDFDDKIGKEVSDAVIPLNQLRTDVHDATRDLQREMRSILSNPTSDPYTALANARAKLEFMSDQMGLTPQEANSIRVHLNQEFGELEAKSETALKKIRTDKEKAEDTLITINQAIRSKNIAGLDEKDREQAFDILSTRVSYQTQAELDKQFGKGNWGAKEFYTGYGSNMADMLASQGAIALSRESKNDLHGLATPPVLDGEPIDPEYLGKVHMYNRLHDLNAPLAEKYAGPDAAVVMASARAKGSTMDPERAIRAAHQELRTYTPEMQKKMTAYLNDDKIQTKVAESISKEIDDAVPGLFRQIFGGWDETKYPPTTEMLKNLKADPIFVGKVKTVLSELAMRTPGAEMDSIVPIAVRNAMTQMTPVGGSWVTGSAQNNGSFMDSIGIPPNHQSFGMATDMVANMVNAFGAHYKWDKNFFDQYKSPSGKESDFSFGDYAAGINWRTTYDAGRDIIAVTPYNSETYIESETLYFSGRLAGAAWMGERLAKLAEITPRRYGSGADIGLEPIETGSSESPIALAEQAAQKLTEIQPGLVEKGNINLTKRPRVQMPDGSIATVRTETIVPEDVGTRSTSWKALNIPTISPDGKEWAREEAIEHYKRTGQHLGKFKSIEQAVSAAEQLHLDQEEMYVTNYKE